VIVEQRTYALRVGAVPEYFEIYEAEGLAIQRSILGRLLGYFWTEVGGLNEVVHQWVYDDHADRERRRAALAADRSWQDYARRAMPLVTAQRSSIMVPAPFMVPLLEQWTSLSAAAEPPAGVTTARR
jgi:hypothetical protein